MRQPDATTPFVHALNAVALRLRLDAIAMTVAVALPSAAILAALLMRLRLGGAASWTAALLIVGMAAVVWLRTRRHRWTSAAAAAAIERAHPECRNVVVTAEELTRDSERTHPWVRERVLRQATDMSHGMPPAQVVTLRRRSAIAVAAVGVTILIALVSVPSSPRVQAPLAGTADSSSESDRGEIRLTAIVTPPTYIRLPPRTLSDPERIEALQGSRLRLEMANARTMRVRFNGRELPAAAGAFEVVLTESGYVAIDATNGGPTDRRLLPVTVLPDHAPVVRIAEPGKDLLLPNAARDVTIAATATDDFALDSLELRYTKVSGSGEQFEFVEGRVPLSIARHSAVDWRGRATLALQRLGLTPGDAVIYRIVGRDARSGDAAVGTSDTFFVEIAGPGQVALDGFEMPVERERYAISQQMIVLKLERLRKREPALSSEQLAAEVAALAAEQRMVRANFIFLLGGSVEDEVEEAEHSHEIQEGRLENSARLEINRAIDLMSRAEQALIAVSTGEALPPARLAVEALQRAFGRNRYFMRTIPVRSRIDPSRRLTGDASSAATWRRDQVPLPPDPPADTARRLVGRLIELAPSLTARTASPAELTALTEEALSVAPGASEWQAIAQRLIGLRDGLGNRDADMTSLLGASLASLNLVVQQRAATVAPPDPARGPLRSAWAEERRRR